MIPEHTKLHPATKLGAVALKVADVQRSIGFYTQIVGLRLHEQPAPDRAVLGDGDQPILLLREVSNATRQPQRSTGLYHAAILLPNRRELARLIRYWGEIGMQFGYADHLVSEAFYINDLDGNGLELYRDRPRDEWTRMDDLIHMENAPIDFDSLLAEAKDAPGWEGLPRGTTLGHMHLRIGDLDAAKAFYIDTLGFDLMAVYPGALFVAAGGYHHHLGLNIWQSRNAPPAPSSSVGLENFEIVLPDAAALNALRERLTTANMPFNEDGGALLVDDPWRNRLHLVVKSMS